jgi:hypothetical protein
MSKTVGYFEGTDSLWLTTLIAKGHDTIPISNGYDNHGKNIRLYNVNNRDDAVIGYLHKVIAPVSSNASTADILHACAVYSIPVLLACPRELQAAAQPKLGKMAEHVQLVDPAEMISMLEEVLARVESMSAG